MMLCAAAEAGDHEEVDRLLSTSPVSPNARGLRRKNALHLASAKGHAKVVQRLLLDKVHKSCTYTELYCVHVSTVLFQSETFSIQINTS